MLRSFITINKGSWSEKHHHFAIYLATLVDWDCDIMKLLHHLYSCPLGRPKLKMANIYINFSKSIYRLKIL